MIMGDREELEFLLCENDMLNEQLVYLKQDYENLRKDFRDLEHDYSEVCKEHTGAILRAAQAEKHADSLRQDLADSQRNFEFIDEELTILLDDLDELSRQVLGHEYEGQQTFDELSISFYELDEDLVKSHREIKLLEGEWEAMDEELREMTEKYRQAAVYHREGSEAIIEELTEEKRLLHKEIARLNEELAVAIGVKDDDYAEEYRKMTVEFAKEHREVRELRGLLSDIHRLSDIEV